MGNVLYDDTVWRRWLLRVLGRLGLHTNYRSFFHVWEHDFLPDVYRGRREFCEAFGTFLLSAGLSPAQIDEVEAACQTRRNQWEATARLLPGVKSTLQKLHAAGMVMGVLSNSEHPATTLVERLQRLGVGGVFKAVVSSIDLERTKPDPVCYLSAARVMELPVDRVVFVGHDADELVGAKRVGMSTIAFNSDPQAKADVFLTRFDELRRAARPPRAPAVASRTRLEHVGPISRTNQVFLFARHDLVRRKPAAADPAVLLEGSWPAGTHRELRGSLDDEIDARFQWIDEEASRLAERLGGPCRIAAEDDALFRSIAPAWLNALGLRYYLVKLLRLVVYFTQVRPLKANDEVRLAVAGGRDEDYVDCVRQLCRLAGARLSVEQVDGPDQPPPAFPVNSRWRRTAADLCGRLEARKLSLPRRRRVVLCGNPRLLDPVCGELVRRDASVFWLYNRFSLRSWLRWRPRGVGQLVCDSSESRVNRLVQHGGNELTCRGVDLRGPVGRWIAERLKTHGPRQTRMVQRIDEHFRRVRPDALVLDEDATPLARSAVALARRHHAASFVVQHGAPACRFGFSPIAADRILAWGPSSREQLVRWGVPPGRIHVVGSAKHEALYRAWRRRMGVRERQRSLGDSQRRRPRFLLLATVPPRDGRPDAIALHLNRRTYAEMLRTALAVVATIPGASLVVKLHPRTPDDPIAHATLAAFPSVESRVVARGPLEPWLARADCVLSCISSAGIDSTLTGVPVIQLLPASSGDVLPHEPWGMLGAASTEAELQMLVTRALAERAESVNNANPNPGAFAHLDGRAVERIADLVLVGKRQREVAVGSALDGRRVDRAEPVPGASPKRSGSTQSQRG